MKEAMDSQQYKSDSNYYQSKGGIQYMQSTITMTAPSSVSIILPLALAQFICSYAGTNMNVAINSIANDLGTTVHNIQITITLFFLLWFFLHIRSRERAGKEPLLSTRLFRNRVSNLGLVTQNVQWIILQGSFFVVSVFLQTVRGYNAIQTGLILTPATIGILLTSMIARRLAERYSQRNLIRVGFVITIVGMILLLFLASATSSILNFIPGLLLMGAGVGVMLTSSVNVVQSSFPEKDQGEISGLSPSVSNLGSSLGTALVGSVLVSSLVAENQTFGLALITVVVIACIGLIAALLLPPNPVQSGTATQTGEIGGKA